MAKQKTAKSAATKKKPAKKAPKKSAAGKAVKKKAAAKPTAEESLGRPKVTADEKLYWLFREDFHARQVFEFLRVETLRELEELSAQEIFRRLTQPMRNTVDNIRKALATKNRHLKDDLEFALEHKAQMGEQE